MDSPLQSHRYGRMILLVDRYRSLSITGFVIGYPLELTGFQGKEVVFSFCNLMHITLSALDVSFLSMFVDITTQVVFPI